MTSAAGSTGRRSLSRFIALLLFVAIVLGLTGCEHEADVASYNLSVAADQFEVQRRIVFINGITDQYLLTIEGLCSLGNDDKAGELSVTCKVGPSAYKKHYLGLSDNVTYLVQQLDPVTVDAYHYRVIFRPSVIVPDVDVDLP